MKIKKQIAAVILAASIATVAPAAIVEAQVDQAEIAGSAEVLTDELKKDLARCLKLLGEIENLVEARKGASFLERLAIEGKLRPKVQEYRDETCAERFGLASY